MAEQVLMLALSPTMEEGTIVKWLKQEGDSIAQGQIICEVETDKATMEYESVNEGTLLKIVVKAGAQAKVGEPIAVVGEPGEDIGELPAAGPALPAAEAAAPAAGSAPVAEAAAPAPPHPAQPATRGPAGPAGALKASPLARKMAAELGIDLRALPGSGPAGRIVKRDIEKALRRAAATRPATTAAAVQPAAAGAALPAGDQRVPLSGKRKVIARRLSESKFSAPHYYLRMDVDAGAMMEARRRLNARLADEAGTAAPGAAAPGAAAPGGKVSPNSFLIKFVAEALKRHPAVNSGWQGDAILRFGRIDIGLAVAQEDGLITPVLRGCDTKGIVEIDRELKALVHKALRNKLTPEEYTGATFTVSSLGPSGILEFTAIINPPGAAILAVGRIHRAPVVDEEGRVRVRSQMILTMSCDHRVIDGAVGAAFLADLKRFIENPFEVLF